MAEIPRPPEMSKADLADLARYHRKLGEYLEQLTRAQGELTLAENLGALVTEATPIQVVSNAFGTGGVEVPCSFEPILVFFKAKALDNNGRTTGTVVNGSVTSWRTGTLSGADGFTIVSGTLADGRYSVVFIALRG
jgi:hypothetical protein